MNADI